MMWENRSVAGGLRQTCVWSSLSLCSHLFLSPVLQYLPSVTYFHGALQCQTNEPLERFPEILGAMSVTAIESRTNTVWIAWFLTKKPWLDMPPFFPEHCPHCWCVRGILQVRQHRRYHEGEKCVVIFISAHITLMRQHHACITHFFFSLLLQRIFHCREKKPNTPPLRILKPTFLFLPYFLCVIGFVLYNCIGHRRSTLRQNCRLLSWVKCGTEKCQFIYCILVCVCFFKRGFSKQQLLFFLNYAFLIKITMCHGFSARTILGCWIPNTTIFCLCIITIL